MLNTSAVELPAWLCWGGDAPAVPAVLLLAGCHVLSGVSRPEGRGLPCVDGSPVGARLAVGQSGSSARVLAPVVSPPEVEDRLGTGCAAVRRQDGLAS